MADYTTRIDDVELIANDEGFTQVMLDGTVIGWMMKCSDIPNRRWKVRHSGVSYDSYAHQKKDAIDTLVWAAVHDPDRVDWSLTFATA